KIGLDGFDEDVDDGVLALPARGIAQDPTERVAGRDGNELLAGLERDIADLAHGAIELIERALGVGVDLDRIDKPVLDGLDARGGVGRTDALGARALLLAFFLGLLLERGKRFELARQRHRRWYLDDLN